MKQMAIILGIFLYSISLFANENEEFRATWVITWEHISAGSSAEANKTLVRQILNNHKQANMNAVLWQSRQSGTAYFNSSYEPWGYYAGYKNPGYDPLAYAVQEAHKRGLELHAWFNVFQTSSLQSGAPAAEHPEWICRDRSGNPMTSYRAVSPGLAAVREYTINVAMEIVRNYDIDGLHLDYVRWNDHTSSMSPTSLGKMAPEHRLLDGMISEDQITELKTNAASRYLYDVEHPYSGGVPDGFTSWEEWWRWSVTEFVRVLHDSIQAVKPWVRLSPAVLGKYNWTSWQGYGTVYQDAALWFNEGYIDQLAPMHYHWTSGDAFYDMLTGSCPNCWSQYIQTGINAGRLFTVGPGSYEFAKKRVWSRHPDVVQTVRNIPWVDGFQFFSYGSWENYKYWEEAGTTFFKRKTKIRPIKLIETLQPPTTGLEKIDSLNYQISVTPPTSTNAPHWFATYRSTDDNYETGNDEIIDIHFGQDKYIFKDRFSGNQDYNGQYYYYATTLNRYWNESTPSNTSLSDPIPSFPPTVISTIPAEGDSISIDSSIEICFSKTMDIASVTKAIEFTPEIAIAQLIWSDNNKTLTIELEHYFQFNTFYSFTINALARDINGKEIDGDGDGIGGDTFILNFKASAQDDVPPQIIYSYPDSAVVDNFDVADIISFVFNEPVASQTLDENSVALYQSSNKIPANFLHSVINGQSIISLQPTQPLAPDTEYTALLQNTITDTSGNQLESYFNVNFKTSKAHYSQIDLIEDFTMPGGWWQPSGSGSTTGIIGYNTKWGYTSHYYLPATSPQKSALLQYEWDEADSVFLIREYLPSTDTKNLEFDTTYTMQCYIFGDGSHNQFRFCVDDGDWSTAANHEVSTWIPIDWYGWRLVEWKMGDPNSVGQWLGNGILEGSRLRIDSFQLTHSAGGNISGKIYFDNLQLVKKSVAAAVETSNSSDVPRHFKLYQNFPNPFNPLTKISFDIPFSGAVELVVFDVLGREVLRLLQQPLIAGHHTVSFNAANMASGTYIYRLKYGDHVSSKQMILMK